MVSFVKPSGYERFMTDAFLHFFFPPSFHLLSFSTFSFLSSLPFFFSLLFLTYFPSLPIHLTFTTFFAYPAKLRCTHSPVRFIPIHTSPHRYVSSLHSHSPHISILYFSFLFSELCHTKQCILIPFFVLLPPSITL